MKIAVAGTGYVGLSLATLLSQNNEVVAFKRLARYGEQVDDHQIQLLDEFKE